MKKIVILAFPLMLSGCFEVGHAFFYAELINSCRMPVQVKVPTPFLDPQDDSDFLSKWVNPKESVKIMNFACIGCVRGVFPEMGYALLKRELPPNYTLTISANGWERTLDKVQFLEVVKYAERIQGYKNAWIIDDYSLCRKKQ